MKKSNRWLILMTLFIFSIVGCSNEVDIGSMLEDYNQNFAQPDTQIEREEVTPDDEKFDASRMLMDNYFVVETGSFVVAGPKDCTSYNWKVVKTSDLGKQIPVRLLKGFTTSSREFAMYVPNSGLDVDSYQLTLTIVNKDGMEFSDSCRLVIYKE